METVSREVQDLSIQSLESTLRKLSNACKSVAEKGSSTALVQKRRDAVEIGLESLKSAWNGDSFCYDEKATLDSKEILLNIIPSIERQIAKAREGSPQKTVNERRITALRLAIKALEDRLA